MRNRIKWSLVTGMLVAVGLMNGCGGGHDSYTPPPPVKATTAAITTAIPNLNGSATTTVQATVVAPPSAPAAVAKVEVVVPPTTTISAKDATGKVVTLTAPAFVFQAPANATPTSAGTSSVPVPVGFTSVDSALVAIDVQIAGASSSTFTNPITISLPVPGKPDGYVVNNVYKNKNDGNGNILVGGPYTVSGGVIKVDVLDLCWFVGDPVYKTSTGSTGSSGNNF
ncbi:MAG: hypothetical protein WCK54_18915 [Desulfuromonadales bacterium]